MANNSDSAENQVMNDNNYPSTRRVTDTHAFMHEDKFDTWLDLTGLFEFSSICEGISTWDRRFLKEVNHFISADTICELQSMGIRPCDIASAKITPTLVSIILSQGLHHPVGQCHIKKSILRDYIAHIKESAMTAVDIQFSHLISNCSGSLQDKLMRNFPSLADKVANWPSALTSSLMISEDWMYALSVHKRLYRYTPEKTPRGRAKSRRRHTYMKINMPSIKSTCVITHDIMILYTTSGHYLLDKNLFLEIINKSCELFCTLLYSHLQSGAGMPENHFEFVTRCITHFMDKVRSYKKMSNSPIYIHHENKGFIYLKSIEGLGVSELIKRGDSHIWVNDMLQNTLWKSIHEAGLSVTEFFQDSQLNEIFDTGTCAQIAEVLGLIKLAGHPSIEVQIGVQKLYDRTHEDLIINEDAVNRSICLLQRDLVINFYHRHRRYPRIDLEDVNLPDEIKYFFTSEINISLPHNLVRLNNIPLEQWNFVHLLKNAEFDPVEHQVGLLKDKSLGLPRKKIVPLLMTTKQESSGSRFLQLGPVEERRALLSFLLSPHFSQDFLIYLEKYQEEPEWTAAVLNFLVIKLTPKEKEEKPEGRMFGASPAQERTRRIVQEFNTMKFMSKYVPEQLLTPDELTLTKKLYSFRKLHELYPNHTVFQVSFDFSKWNNSMRRASIDVPAGRILDRWFNTRIYGRTMEAYENTLVYYKDNHYQTFWDGQPGGIEGLNQATWTYIFVGGIKQALERLGVISQVTVKGDDVRAAIAIPNRAVEQHGLPTMRDNILHELQVLCRDMGWTLNPQESFVSLNLICTSKQYQYKDTWLPASSKKIMKAESLANLVFPTTEDIISSVFSTAHSACAQSTNVLPAFSTACIIASRILWRDFTRYKCTVEQITMCLCWPQILGGPGALPLQTFFIRGENDMLSVSISLIRHILLLDHPLLSPIAKSILSQRIKANPNYKQFLGDPYSIPIDVPPRANTVLKDLIRVNMKYWIRNNDLLFLLTLTCQQDEDRLVEVLTSMTPLCPKLMTSIYENSCFYLKEEVIAKFMLSSTIFTFFQKGKTKRMSVIRAHAQLKKVLNAANKRETYWIGIIKNKGVITEDLLGVILELWLDYNNVCTTELSHIIREQAWGKPVKTLTYPSLVDQTMIYTANDINRCHPNWDIRNISSQVSVHISDAIYQTDDNSHHYASAPHVYPWIGSKTALKLMLPAMDTEIKSPTINKILNLLMIKRTGYYLGHDFHLLIDKVIESLTCLSTQNLDVLMPEGRGGHITHRVPMNSFSLVTMPNTRPNVAQLVSINNESMMVLKNDSRNRTINFAARNYHIIALVTAELQTSNNFGDTENQDYLAIFHNDLRIPENYQLCPFCCGIVDDEMIQVEGASDLDFSKYSEYKYIGASEHDNQVLRANMGAAIIGKARRYLREDFIDVRNPVNIAIAANKVITAEFKASRALFAAAQRAQSKIIPSAQLAEIIAINTTGGASIKSNFSIQLLRSIHPAVLYNSVLQECIQIAFHAVGSSLSDDGITLIMDTQKHLDNAAQVFFRLTHASVLNQLSVGSAQLHYCDAPLIWTTKSYNDPHIACKIFLKHHEQLIRMIISGRFPPLPKLRFYVNMESNDTVMASCRQMADDIKGLILHKLNGYIKSVKPLNVLNDLVLQYLMRHEMEEEDGRDFIQINEDQWRQEFFDVILPEWIAENDFGFHYTGQLVVRWIMIGNITTKLIDGEWVNWDAQEILHMSESFELITSLLTDDTIAPDMKSLFVDGSHDDAVVQRICDIYGEHTYAALEALFFQLIETPYINDDAITFGIEQSESINRWNSIYGIRRLCIMTEEDAERILKAIPADIGFDEDTQVDTTFPSVRPRNQMRDSIYFCPQRRADHMLYDAHQLAVERSERSEELFNRNLNQLVPLNPRIQEHLVNLDYTYYFQTSSTINWTSGRLIDVTRFINLRQYLGHHGGSNLAIVIGDGTGGVSKSLLLDFPSMVVIYVSKYFKGDSGAMADDACLTSPPYEFQTIIDPARLLSRLIWNGFFPGDINVASVRSMISQKVQQRNEPAILIVSDAELPLVDNVQLTMRFLVSLFLIIDNCTNEDSIIIIKLLLTAHRDMIEMLIYLRHRYMHWHLVRNIFSRSSQDEVYLIIGQRRGIANIAGELEKIVVLHTHSPQYHVESVTYVTERCADILRLIHWKHATGTQDLPTLHRHRGHRVRDMAPCRSLTLFYKDLGINPNITNTDFCALRVHTAELLQYEVQIQIDALKRYHTLAQAKIRRNRKEHNRRIRMHQGQRGINGDHRVVEDVDEFDSGVRMPGGAQISQISSGYLLRLESFVQSYIISDIITRYEGDFRRLIEVSPRLLRIIIQDLQMLIHNRDMNEYVTIVFIDNDWVIRCNRANVVISRLLKHCCRSILKFLGSIDYLKLVIHEHGRDAAGVVQIYHPTLVINPCCIASAAALANVCDDYNIAGPNTFTPILPVGIDMMNYIDRIIPNNNGLELIWEEQVGRRTYLRDDEQYVEGNLDQELEQLMHNR